MLHFSFHVDRGLELERFSGESCIRAYFSFLKKTCRALDWHLMSIFIANTNTEVSSLILIAHLTDLITQVERNQIRCHKNQY